MGQQWHYCKLKPLGEYFFGGERNFGFGNTEREKSEYFIRSEEVPNQSTLLGMLRFMILKKEGQLNETWKISQEQREIQNTLIGKEGFSINLDGMKKNYGKLDSLTPLFLLDHQGQRYIKTPLNHKVGEKSYTPLTMKGNVYTNKGTSILPEGYVAKEGLEDSYLNIDDRSKELIGKEKIFGSLEHTRISKSSTEDGFFKKEYKNLKNGFSFGFYVLAEKEILPEKDIVYLGQDKSTFCVEIKEVVDSEVEDFFNKATILGTGAHIEGVNTYIALSDAYMPSNTEKESLILYSIVEKKLFRSLKSSSSNETFKASRSKSQLYQLVKAGSVFYVSKDKANSFEEYIDKPEMKQIGFNYIVKL